MRQTIRNLLNSTSIRYNTALYVFCIIVWIGTCLLFGSNYPVNYDSINYALGIAYDFDIRQCQPHAYGYIYHVLLSRIWLPFIQNPFRVQQAQNILYLTAALFLITPWKKRQAPEILLPALLPVSLYFAGASVIHAVSFTASAAIARCILRLERREIHPLFLTTVYCLFIGFRQDLSLFMGPVILVALIRYKCSIRQWVAIVLSGIILNAVWYIGTSWSSGWLSPWSEANRIVAPFVKESALLYGAPLYNSLRVILRFILYLPAALGPGGLIAAYLYVKKTTSIDRLYLFSASLPFMLYGILLYFPFATYYATIFGFLFAWVLYNDHFSLRPKLTLLLVVLNLIFFMYVPAPLTRNFGDFGTRSKTASVVKQLSYMGAAGRTALDDHRPFEDFLDVTVRQCSSFYVRDAIFYDGLPYGRIWNLLAESEWHNTLCTSPDSAECRIGIIRDGEAADTSLGTIGVWYDGNVDE